MAMTDRGAFRCLALGGLLLLACCTAVVETESTALQPGEGTIQVPGGRVWYRVVGSGHSTPLLLLHGGPGATSHAFRPMERLASERPVVVYDQLGSGRSDMPEDPSLWSVDRFVQELVRVREELGLQKVHILGHSWGSMLAVEYMLTKKPRGVVSLILAGPALSIPKWLEDANRLRADLPSEVQAVLSRHEEAGTYDSEEYLQASMEFYRRHLCRLDPWPEEMLQTTDQFGFAVYRTMWGPSEFYATGTLKDFDRSDRLHEIDVPTLLTVGRYDEATPETAAWYQSLMPDARLVVFENSSHMTMLEEPEHYVQVVGDFLREVEQRQAR